MEEKWEENHCDPASVSINIWLMVRVDIRMREENPAHNVIHECMGSKRSRGCCGCVCVCVSVCLSAEHTTQGSRKHKNTQSVLSHGSESFNTHTQTKRVNHWWTFLEATVLPWLIAAMILWHNGLIKLNKNEITPQGEFCLQRKNAKVCLLLIPSLSVLILNGYVIAWLQKEESETDPFLRLKQKLVGEAPKALA